MITWTIPKLFCTDYTRYFKVVLNYNTTVLSLQAISSSACMLVDVYLQLFHAAFFASTTCAPLHFNVIAHFLAQCGSEPWTTMITASAPTCTPLWVPQRVIKVPLGFPWSSVPRLAEIVFSNKWRCSWTRIRGTGVVAASGDVILWPTCYKRPDVVPWSAVSHRQPFNIIWFNGNSTSQECICTAEIARGRTS